MKLSSLCARHPCTPRCAHAGILYDSAINEHWDLTTPMPTSPNGGQRLWPYTMDYGIPQICNWVGTDASW